MKQHGSQERIYRVMDALKSFGAAAKPSLPELYKAREYYLENLGPGKPIFTTVTIRAGVGDQQDPGPRPD